ERIGRALERDGLITRDCENTYLNFDPAEGAPLNDLIGHSITYRVAVGPRTGQKVFTLRSFSAQRDDDGRKGVAEYAGFSLHAGIGIEADAREKLERLCRHVSRPAIAAERLTLAPQGDVRFCLKTPLSGWNDAHRARAARLHGAPCGARAAAACPSNEIYGVLAP